MKLGKLDKRVDKTRGFGITFAAHLFTMRVQDRKENSKC